MLRWKGEKVDYQDSELEWRLTNCTSGELLLASVHSRSLGCPLVTPRTSAGSIETEGRM